MFFHQRLAGALHDAAMELALDQQRVDHVADIVNRGVADEAHLAGVGVDLDLADVAAVRIGAFAAREGAGFEQAGLGAARQPRRHERGAGDLGEAYGLIGAGDREAAVLRIRCRARRPPSCGRRCGGPWR